MRKTIVVNEEQYYYAYNDDRPMSAENMRYGSHLHKTFEQEKQKMYKEFAAIAQRIDGATADVEIAAREQMALTQERDAWCMKFKDDLKVGTHAVPGGQVIVKEIGDSSKTINFYETDYHTLRFALHYAEYWVDLKEKEARINTLQTTRRIVLHERAAGYSNFRALLARGAPTDEDLKVFARRHHVCCTDLKEKEMLIAALQAEYQKLRSEEYDYYNRLCGQLVDGDYAVEGGVVIVRNGGAKFHANT